MHSRHRPREVNMIRLNRSILTLGLLAMGLAGLGCLSGSVNVDGVPVDQMHRDYSGPPPQAANIPPGPEHDACRLELDRAFREIQHLRAENADLREDLRDDDSDAAKYKRRAEEYKREIDRLEDRIDDLEDQIDDLRDD
jgi:peptidoglycan hydrolase CwlO-like protein